MSETREWQSPIEGSLDRRTFQDGELDEVFGGRYAHLERMNDRDWFLIIGHDDGSETAIWFKSSNLHKPFFEHRKPPQVPHD